MQTIDQLVIALDGVGDAFWWLNLGVTILVAGIIFALLVILLPLALQARASGVSKDADENQRTILMLLAGTYTPLRPAGILMLLAIFGLLACLVAALWLGAQTKTAPAASTLQMILVFLAPVGVVSLGSYQANRWPNIVLASRLGMLVAAYLYVGVFYGLLRESNIGGRSIYGLLVSCAMIIGMGVGSRLWRVAHPGSESAESMSYPEQERNETETDRSLRIEEDKQHTEQQRWPRDASVVVRGVVSASIPWQEGSNEQTRCLWVKTTDSEYICSWMTDGIGSRPAGVMNDFTCLDGPLQLDEVAVRGHVRHGFPYDPREIYVRFPYVEAEQVTIMRPFSTLSRQGDWHRARGTSLSSRRFPCAMAAWWSGEWVPALQLVGALFRRDLDDDMLRALYRGIVRERIADALVEGPDAIRMAYRIEQNMKLMLILLFCALVTEDRVRHALFPALVEDYGRFAHETLSETAALGDAVWMVREAIPWRLEKTVTVFVEELSDQTLDAVQDIVGKTQRRRCYVVAGCLLAENAEEWMRMYNAVVASGATLCLLETLTSSAKQMPPFNEYLKYAWEATLSFCEGKALDDMCKVSLERAQRERTVPQAMT